MKDRLLTTKPSASAVKLRRGAHGRRAVDRLDALWERIEPLPPKVERRFRCPGRKRLLTAKPSKGSFSSCTRDAWRQLPLELGFGSGSTCYRRLDEWQRVGVRECPHQLLLSELRAAGEIEWARAIADSSHVQAKKGSLERSF